jgi:outer membrane lipoprotein-sorting protein
MQKKYTAIEDLRGVMVITTQFNDGEELQVINFTIKMPDKYCYGE